MTLDLFEIIQQSKNSYHFDVVLYLQKLEKFSANFSNRIAVKLVSVSPFNSYQVQS